MYKKLIDSIAYVVWSLALWMLSYYQFLKCDFSSIQEGYAFAAWLWVIAAIILYGNSKTELSHEILKSCLILIGTSILDMVYNQNGTAQDLVKRIIVLLIYQLGGYIVIIFIGKSQKLHGGYAKGIALFEMLLLGILHFVLKCNIYISLFAMALCGLLLGWKYHVLNRLEQKKNEVESEQKIKEEKLKLEEAQELKRIVEHYHIENAKQKDKILKLENKISIYETKKIRSEKRKMRKKSNRKTHK